MPRKGYSEEKILYALRQVKRAKKVSEVCREMGSRRRRSTAGSGATQAGAERTARITAVARREPGAQDAGR